MVALVASVSALALLGLVTHVPGWLGHDEGFTDVQPGLLTVARDARGIATLGGGVTVSLYPDGMRVSRGSDLLTQTVIGGSMLSAVEGTTTGSGPDTREHVDTHLDNVAINELVFLPGRATYFGRVYDSHRSMALTIRIELAGSFIRVSASVNGADGVVFHLDHETRTMGLAPALPPVNLRRSANWIAPSALAGQFAFSTPLGTDIGAGPQRVARGVDVRSAGRTDLHIWSDAAYLTVSSQARPKPTDTATP
jgi:hypothetical protein